MELSFILIMARIISYAYCILQPTATGNKRLVDSFLVLFAIILYYANFAKSFLSVRCLSVESNTS